MYGLHLICLPFSLFVFTFYFLNKNFDAGDSFSIAEINDDITLMNSTFNRWKVMVTRPGGVSAADPEQ